MLVAGLVLLAAGISSLGTGPMGAAELGADIVCAGAGAGRICWRHGTFLRSRFALARVAQRTDIQRVEASPMATRSCGGASVCGVG